MRSILKSTLGRAATIVAIAGVAVTALGASAEAGPYHHRGWDRGYHHGWEHPDRWDHARWYGGGYYAPRYYVAPPAVVYPAPYYGPPSLNFNIPLG